MIQTPPALIQSNSSHSLYVHNGTKLCYFMNRKGFGKISCPTFAKHATRFKCACISFVRQDGINRTAHRCPDYRLGLSRLFGASFQSGLRYESSCSHINVISLGAGSLRTIVVFLEWSCYSNWISFPIINRRNRGTTDGEMLCQCDSTFVYFRAQTGCQDYDIGIGAKCWEYCDHCQ